MTKDIFEGIKEIKSTDLYKATQQLSESQIIKPILKNEAVFGQFALKMPLFSRTGHISGTFTGLPISGAITKAIDTERVTTILQQLAEYGWYINYDFTPAETGEIGRLLDKKKIRDLDKLMIHTLQIEAPQFVKSVIQAYPERSKPLQAAFDAHQEGKYDLSIPVFFAQSDGICKQHTNALLFMNNRKDHTPLVRVWASANTRNSLHKALAAALLNKGALQLHFTEPNKIPFTRHSVLHGETNDYGTEINSFKAMSLLFYVHDICKPTVY